MVFRVAVLCFQMENDHEIIMLLSRAFRIVAQFHLHTHCQRAQVFR